MTRRLLLHVTGALGALVAALVAAPPLLFWWRSSRSAEDSAEDWVDIGSPRKLAQGEWLERRFSVERQSRWRQEIGEELVYVRREDRDLTVLSPICPHARCLVRPEGDGFACRCHRSSFDVRGRVLDGPAPRALDPIEWKVENGRLLVRYQRFKPGVSHSEALEA